MTIPCSSFGKVIVVVRPLRTFSLLLSCSGIIVNEDWGNLIGSFFVYVLLNFYKLYTAALDCFRFLAA